MVRHYPSLDRLKNHLGQCCICMALNVLLCPLCLRCSGCCECPDLEDVDDGDAKA
jgi:hypothetical protein